LLLGGTALPALAAPRFQMPFVCGEYRRVSTSPTHTPSRLAIDLNVGYGNQDLGSIVVASAGGRAHLRKAKWRSYGRYVVIDHGGGWQTIYAHLAEFAVRNGARVKQGDKIGWVGNNKGLFLAHLHYEQRHEGRLRRIRFGGHRIAYRDNPRYIVYKSANNCRAKPKPVAPAKPATQKPQPAPRKATSTARRRPARSKSAEVTRTAARSKRPSDPGPMLPLLPFVGVALGGAGWISRRVYHSSRS
jgi:murein DD-endopeptidase MepM/ murein hydrolase activator NlpD